MREEEPNPAWVETPRYLVLVATVENVRLPSILTADSVDGFASEKKLDLARAIDLELHNYESSQLGAEARLLQWMRVLQRREAHVTTRIHTGEARRNPLETRYAEILGSSLLGLIISNLGGDVASQTGRSLRSEVLKEQFRNLAATDGILSAGDWLAAPVFDWFPSPKTADALKSDQQSELLPWLLRVLADLGIEPLTNIALMDDIATFLFQTLRNTEQHATSDIDGSPIQAMRFVLIRRVNLREHSWGELAGRVTSHVKDYLSVIESVLARAYLSVEKFVEFTVADAGPGIAATMAQTRDVLAGPLALEEHQLQKAFTRSGTSKPPGTLGAGLGLWKVLRATHDLRGLISIRTGRLHAYRHYLDDLRVWPDPRLLGTTTANPRLEGTAVTLLVPWTDPGLFG